MRRAKYYHGMPQLEFFSTSRQLSAQAVTNIIAL
jgi:hypothetical protein